MEKNDYLLINDLIYQLYSEESLRQLKPTFLKRLKLIIPYSYASIMSANETPDHIFLSDPVCNPTSFEKVEAEYLEMEKMDHLDWILYSSETVLLRESDVVNDNRRLSSPIYQKCYRNYNIYDTLQMSIVYERKIYAVLTLYRTKSEGKFTDTDIFYLQSLSKHLNFLFYTYSQKSNTGNTPGKLKEFTDLYGLTRRESEILGYILDCLGNDEILDRIPITEHTLQKHIQNIYRKCGVSTRWELLKL